MSHTIERLHISVEGVTHALAPLETVGNLKRDITEVIRAGGGFVDVSVDGGQRLSIFFTSTTPVTISAKTVRVDSDIIEATRPTAHVGDIDPYASGYVDLI